MIIRRSWRNGARGKAILDDEFQDTNARQRDLVQLPNGGRGCLFIVGDAKQSIYGFRGADVTVFRRERECIGQAGLVLELSKTYRAHDGLVARTRPAPADFGSEPDETRPTSSHLPCHLWARGARPGCPAPARGTHSGNWNASGRCLRRGRPRSGGPA